MGKVTILGVFVADTAYRADRPPQMGETILGKSFALGPGGKGSNQAVAAAKVGADTHFITRLGDDDFAQLAYKTWQPAGVSPSVTVDPESFTGAAYIFIEDRTGNNAIIICPGAAGNISPQDLRDNQDLIAGSDIFMTQLEQPVEAAEEGLRIARDAGVITILNPAPAAPLSPSILALCDYITPNESETEALTGLPVTSVEQAAQAAARLVEMGAGRAVITLGEMGVYLHGPDISAHIPAIIAGPVVETTGAGDAFNGGFAAALSAGADPLTAARHGVATAGISVTRPGTAPSMPDKAEVDALLARS